MNATKATENYCDFVSRWDGTLVHAQQLLVEFDGWDLLDGATEAYRAEDLDRDAGEFDEEAAQVLDVLRDLGYEN